MIQATQPGKSIRYLAVMGAAGLLALGLIAAAAHIQTPPSFTATSTASSPSLPLFSAAAVSNSPTLDHAVYLPLIANSVPARIGPLNPLSASVPRYGKFEVAFTISTTATNFYFPYDPAAPYNESGVTVDLLIADPNGTEKTVPCFFYQPVDVNLTPAGQPDWRCRYSPEAIGTWQYRVKLIDAIGQAESAEQSFNVTSSSNHGFVRVSPTDSHYFEFDDGTPFLTPLINVESGNPLNGLTQIRANILKWGQNGVRFVRWFPTGESGNYYVVPYGDELKVSWGFGAADTVPVGEPGNGHQFTFQPYYYTGQSVKAVPSARYRLSLRAQVTGNKVFRPQVGNSVIEIRASDWQTYTIETTSTGPELMVWLHDGFNENDHQTGTINVHEIKLQRDETGSGGWGPNLLTRGDADTYQYVDQVGAARLDEIMRLSEQHGVYHKLTLFHKNDQVLGRLLADGSATATWDINHFYSSKNEVVRWLEKAYARYFVARWAYSPALHSLELANENMLTQNSYDAAFDVMGYIRSIEPRTILLSNSFWGYFVEPFWNDASRGYLMDYADKHWYARPGSTDVEVVSALYTDSAANVRQCQKRFKEYRTGFAYNKPIVRGETGVWQASFDPMNFGAGTATYFHKQVWAQMGDQCAGEWYTDYLDTHNLWGDYLRYEQFLQGEPLTNGHYADVGSDTGSIAIANSIGIARAWGKVATSDGRGVLWIDNANDTWKRVADGLTVTPASTTVTLSNLPNGTYQVLWFNTATGATTTNTQAVSNGQLALNVSALAHDVAVKFRKQ